MPPFANALIFVFGAVCSLSTSWLLVSRLERIGERFGFSDALLGLVAALAADAPEVSSAVTAILHHQRQVGIGVVLGSNVFNLAALLGLGAVVARRIALHKKVVLFAGAVALWVAVVTLASLSGGVGPDVNLALALVVLVPYVAVVSAPRRLANAPAPLRRQASWLLKAVSEEASELTEAVRAPIGTLGDGAVAVVSLVVVIASSAAMETTASNLGHHFGIRDIVVGGIALAAVTSLPNMVAAIHLASRGRGAAVLSTALNSNTLNVIAGLLVPAAIAGAGRPTGPVTLVAGWYAGLTLVSLLLAYLGRGLRSPSGWAIIVGYIAFVVLLVTLPT